MTQQFIYSVNDFFDKWELLMKDVADRRNKAGKTFYEDFYNCHKAVALLLLHGLTIEQVIEIRLDDLTSDGVKGYDLQLTDREIKFLMEYRNQDGFHRANNERDAIYINYVQNTVVRTSKNVPISKATVNDMLKPIWFEDSPYRELFKPDILNKAYRYAILYQYCKDNHINMYLEHKALGKELNPHIEKIAEITGLKLDPAEPSKLFRQLKDQYRAKYLIPYEEWLKEQETKQPEEQPKKQLKPEVKVDSVKDDSVNRQLLRHKLLERIDVIESELDELRQLVELLN